LNTEHSRQEEIPNVCKHFVCVDSQMLWCRPIIPALRRLRLEGHKLKAILGYIARL
jgi:hypothetical protein